MTITIPDELMENPTAEEQKHLIELAVFLYEKKILTMGQAKRMAKLNQIAFQHELAKRDVCIHYDVSDLEDDLKTLQILKK